MIFVILILGQFDDYYIIVQECNFVLGQTEKYFQSWTYWDTAVGWYFWDSEGNIKPEVHEVFARPYPWATAGLPVNLSFDIFTKGLSTILFKVYGSTAVVTAVLEY